jgi:MoxR-like ATPase
MMDSDPSSAESTEASSISLDGVTLHLGRPVTSEHQWVGQAESLRSLLACWLVVSEQDLPLAPRVIGPPGIGKTTLASAAARSRGQDLYIYQCTSDTRPEDLLVTPVLSESGKIAYHASALVTAMIRGGVCVLDEGNRMSEKSWASLAPLLDHRRYAESIIAGVTIQAHADFRCVVTMNDDESTYEVPEYILSRLQPTLELGFPDRADEMEILQYHLPFARDELLRLTVDFLQRAHGLDLEHSPRDGIHIIRYALKRLAQAEADGHPLSMDSAWHEALAGVLGQDGADLDRVAAERDRALKASAATGGLTLEDLFFGDPSTPGESPQPPDDES